MTAGVAIDLTGRTVLITGAASGIGRSMALAFAEAGGRPVLLDVDDASIDILINNAGTYPLRPFLEIDEPFLDDVLQVNLEAVFWMCQGFIRRRGDAGGVIINVSSVEAVAAFKKGMAAYISSKAGVLGLTRALASEYGEKGYRVNAILPGGIKTPGTMALAKTVMTKADLGLVKTAWDYLQRLPLNRYGTPAEVASVAIFLASDLASYVHGAAIPVDGGFLGA